MVANLLVCDKKRLSGFWGRGRVGRGRRVGYKEAQGKFAVMEMVTLDYGDDVPGIHAK